MTRVIFTIAVDSDDEAQTKQTAALVETVNKFGGCTVRAAEGGWRDAGGALQRSPTVELVVVTAKHMPVIKKHAQWLAKLFSQQEVLVATETLTEVEACSASQCHKETNA